MEGDLFGIIVLAGTILYGLLLLFLAAGIFRLSAKRDREQKSISVIVAARNESQNLNQLISALEQQNYPAEKYEMIIVDDRSTDGSFELLMEAQEKYKNLKLGRIEKESANLVGKKGALAKGIDLAENEILAFTDADCLPQQEWLSEINALMTSDTDFLCGYSPLVGSNSLVNKLKNLERSSIFAVIAGSFGWEWGLTSVARSQVYRKSIFEKIKGFEGIGTERSGDDDLLLQKMSSSMKKRNFLFKPQAQVVSIDHSQIQEQVDLEVRRASKWRVYPPAVKLLTLSIMICYVLLCGLAAACVFNLVSWEYLFSALGFKIGAEFFLMIIFLGRIHQLRQLWLFPVAEILYIPYYLYFGLRGTFGRYKWKN